MARTSERRGGGGGGEGSSGVSHSPCVPQEIMPNYSY